MENQHFKRGLRRNCGILEDQDFGIGIYNKGEIIMERNPNMDNPDMKVGIEYKMSAELAKQILKADNTKRKPQEILCEYVNRERGLKGYCLKVITDL